MAQTKKYGEGLRGINVLCPLNGKAAPRPPAQQRERFIEHKIAGDAIFAVRAQFLPDSHSAAMMLIIEEVARQECPGVDENHFSSLYRYLLENLSKMAFLTCLLLTESQAQRA